MSDEILVDTDVMIDFLRGHNKAIEFIDKYSSRISLSTIVVAELYAGVKGKHERIVLDSVHPEIGKFGRDQGARKILPRAYV